ncbi:TPA: TRASH domain-containing protein, partial [Candidatus Bathyarchaeota archaeon]|nr:TRASH domain-containing protein [Candidatus Bathyarchaeota archaeon]
AVAEEAGVTTPTVRDRVKKMVNAGVIKKFSAVVDAERVEDGVSALVSLKTDLGALEKVVEHLSRLDEVRNMFVTSGEANMVIRITSPNKAAFLEFLNKQIGRLKEVEVLSNQVILRTVKDEPGFALRGELYAIVKCDACGQEIKGEPFILNVKGGKRFFCCKGCLAIYKGKYGKRLREESNSAGSIDR